jgi:transcriptional antiterminator RfaH
MNDWYALYTKARNEKQVETNLCGRGFETYLPMLPAVRNRDTRKLRPAQPLFPCYLFVRFDLEVVGVSAVRWTPGLRDLVMFTGRPAIVEPEFIEGVRLRLSGGELARRLEQPRFPQGTPVRMRSGPLSDLDAIFEHQLAARERAVILVKILGRMTRAEVDLRELERRSMSAHF